MNTNPTMRTVRVTWHIAGTPARPFTHFVRLIEGYSDESSIPRILEVRFSVPANLVQVDHIEGNQS